MLLLHNKVSGGVQYSQIMIPSFFDRFYVMPPLTNGVHYSTLPPSSGKAAKRQSGRRTRSRILSRTGISCTSSRSRAR